MNSNAALADARERYRLLQIVAVLLDPAFNDKRGMLWYYGGLYDLYGFDEDGVTYRLIENDGSEDVEAALTSERMVGSEERRLYNTWGR